MPAFSKEKGMAKTTTKKARPAVARELIVQMQINRGLAAAGASGPNIADSALISLLVTLDGAPVDDLGALTGDGTGSVSLPAGWTLTDGFSVRPFGCSVSVTEFVNESAGIYDIRIVPFLATAACAWLSGEYIYAVNIRVTRKIAGRTVVLQGGALAKLTIL